MLNYVGEYCDACQAAVTVIMSGDAVLNPESCCSTRNTPQRSCYLTPATPATPASYIKGTATGNLPWKNRLAKVCRIHENSAQNLQVTHEEFSIFLPKNSDNLSHATVVPAVHLFSNTYPTPCLPLAGFESINAGNDVGGSYDL